MQQFRHWFTTYRQLFAVSLAVNVLLLCLAATGHFEWARENAGTMATLTFLFAVLTRNEIFMRGVFWATVCLVRAASSAVAVSSGSAVVILHVSAPGMRSAVSARTRCAAGCP
jgi:hypothetical protein